MKKHIVGDCHKKYSDNFGRHCSRLLLYFNFLELYNLSTSLCLLAHSNFQNVNGDHAFVFSASYCPVLSFLVYFAHCPSFLLFLFHSSFVYNEPISVLTKGMIKTIFLGLHLQTPILSPCTQGPWPKMFLVRTSPGAGQCFRHKLH